MARAAVSDYGEHRVVPSRPAFQRRSCLRPLLDHREGTPLPGRSTGFKHCSSLEQLEPILRTVKDKLIAAAPEHFTVEFGVKLGGETGIILTKGTAEVNLKITMTWDRESRAAGEANGRV